MKNIALQSHAKVNLYLEVTGKRPDGYHILKMIMTRISLHDDITLTLKEEGISIACDNPAVPEGEENIAWRAARDFIKSKQLQTGVQIEIKKRIPLGGGLGGGSSNAAAVLLGMNELFSRVATREELMSMGLALGTDIPFFVLNKSSAFAEGIGEILTPLEDLPKLWFVLINPGIEIPTASIYKALNLRLTNCKKNLSISRFDCSLTGVNAFLHNDLEEVAFGKYPEVKKVKALFLEGGALGALMSGSGSTVFGLFKDFDTAGHFLSEMGNDIVSKGWRHYLVSSF